MGTEPAQRVRKNTPLTDKLETGTCCCPSETRKDPLRPKSFRPISILCHLYKLYERLILNRLSPTIEHALIPEQAGFRPGKSCTSQVLNHTQHIEDGFETGKIALIVLVDLSAARDTINHRRLLENVYNNDKGRSHDMHDSHSSGEPSFLRGTWTEKQYMANTEERPTTGGVLAPLLFNVYNDQPIHPGTSSFYLCMQPTLPSLHRAHTLHQLRKH